ncbi:MAG TPA: Crp/Fnr family transcriptional regulator [Chitinophagaceae bacterium]|nr:Crp/Fnr family transcriptional regulator [Chitinophagaceae bacterium]
MQDTTPLISALSYFHPLSEGIENYIKQRVFPSSFLKGELLLQAGNICENIYFIRKGAVRGFIKEGDKDITTWITAENEIVSSIYRLYSNQPAAENIQAIEDCEMLTLAVADLEKLYIEFPDFNVVARKLVERYYVDAEERAFIARLTNAEHKYSLFITRYAHLTNRIPLKYIASFLGMTLETLSRVRKRLSMKVTKVGGDNHLPTGNTFNKKN